MTHFHKFIYSAKVNDMNNINSRKNYNRFSVVFNVWRVWIIVIMVLANETTEDMIFQVIRNATISLESETGSDTRESYSSSMSEIISLARHFSGVCTFYTRLLINNSEIEQIMLRIIIYVILNYRYYILRVTSTRR